MLLSLIITSTLAAAESSCGSVAECNRLGSAAFQAQDYAQANAHFERQVDYADSAVQAAETDDPALEKARQVALNNAALTALRGGQCLRAAAWLSVADAAHPGTVANRKQWQARCAAAPSSDSLEGEYWQYAGHGAWNRIVIQPSGDETLRLDAFWMRISAGPLDQYGIAAFGELEDVAIRTDAEGAAGLFEGNDGEPCDLRVERSADGLRIAIPEDERCQTGGAGAYLGGDYLRVEASPES